MGGLVNTNVFSNGLKHSSAYAYFGVDKNYPDKNKESSIQTKPTTTPNQNQPKDTFDKSEDTAVNVGSSFDNAIDTVVIPNQNKRQRLKTFGIIGASAVAVGGIVMLCVRGKLTKSATDLLSKVIENAGKKIENLKEKPTISKAEGYYLTGLQQVNRFANKMRGAIFNITPVKDVIFKKFANEKCGLKKPCDSITEGFRKLSFATVKTSYANAGQDISTMTEAFSAMNKRIAAGEFKGGKSVPSSVIEKLDRTTKFISSEFESSFSQQSVNGRSEKLMKDFEQLDDRVYDTVYGKIKTFVTDVNEWTTFVSERLVERDKNAFMGGLSAKRRVITNKPKDNYKLMSGILTELENSIDPQHEASRNCVKNIRALTEKYVSVSGKQEQQAREKIVKEINSNIEKTVQMSVDAGKTPAQTRKINELLHNFSQVVNSDKKGAIEEMLTVYKEILPPEEYVQLRKIADKASNSLNKAVYNEGFEYFDKLRDLAVGSALTDVAIGVGVPMVTTGVAMAGANTKEKKRSVALKYGIPLIAGVATSTLCTVRLISGGKALLLGGAVTVIGNEICERLDNYILKKEGKFVAKNKSAKQKDLKTPKA